MPRGKLRKRNQSRRGRSGKKRSGKGGTTFPTTDAAMDRQVSRATHATFNRKVTIRAIGSPAIPFPSVVRTTMTCDEIGSLAAGTAAADYLVNLNGIFKPFSTGSSLPSPLTAVAGLYPSGYNTYFTATGPYSAYVVLGSAIRVELLTANAGDNLVFTIVPTGSSGAVYSDAVHAGQGAFSVSRLTGFGNGGRSMLSKAVSVAEVAGVDHKEVVDSPNFGAAYNATPANRLYWQIWFATCDGAVTSGTLTYRVSVSYDVMAILPTWTLANDDDVKTTMSPSSLQAILDAKEGAARATYARSVTSILQSDVKADQGSAVPAKRAGPARK